MYGCRVGECAGWGEGQGGGEGVFWDWVRRLVVGCVEWFRWVWREVWLDGGSV